MRGGGHLDTWQVILQDIVKDIGAWLLKASDTAQLILSYCWPYRAPIMFSMLLLKMSCTSIHCVHVHQQVHARFS